MENINFVQNIDSVKQIWQNILNGILAGDSEQTFDSQPEEMVLSVYRNLISNDSSLKQGVFIVKMGEFLEKDLEIFESHIQEMIQAPQMRSPLSYIINELFCNIDQHANVEYGFACIHYERSNNTLYIGIADGGISIYGSYVKHNKFINQVGDSDANAIYLAQSGFSTKNLPNAENRGYGISTSSAIVVKGFNGTFSLISGEAMLLYNRYNKSIIELPASIVWPGTFILMEIPIQEKTINLYDYVG